MIMITGGAGFIGLNFAKFLVENKYATPEEILVVDKIGYASHAEEILNYARLAVIDIANKEELESLFIQYDIEGVVNFAAESHVDRSISDCMPFVTSNIIGTINVAQLCVKYEVIKLLHISTDEVFGEVPYPGKFNEYSNLNPRNPYSASKASAECFINAFINTNKLRAVIVNMSNNYGPFQNEEKLIPLTIKKLMNNEFVPVYGNGKQVRDWIYVEDACRAIYKVFVDGKIGERYCIGGDNEIQNIDLVNMIMQKMGVEDRIQYVQDRPGHDTRYYTDTSKLKSLGWTPRWTLSDGLDATIEWMKTR
jgi:dTDP-glucose 4,6-dehydratase